MAANVNLTASVDRDLLQRAKVIAAKLDTSVNALLNAELRYLVETFEWRAIRTTGRCSISPWDGSTTTRR